MKARLKTSRCDARSLSCLGGTEVALATRTQPTPYECALFFAPGAFHSLSLNAGRADILARDYDVIEIDSVRGVLRPAVGDVTDPSIS